MKKTRWTKAEAEDGQAWHIVAEEPFCSECMISYANGRLDMLDEEAEDYRKQRAYIDADIQRIVVRRDATCQDCGATFRKATNKRRALCAR